MFLAVFLSTVLTVLIAQDANGQEERIYIIAIGHDYGSMEYMGADGYLQGFGHDIINAVCLEARIDCRIVWDSRDGNCWSSTAGMHPSGGRGIHDRWFDGCSGWDATVERIHVFGFSAAYTNILNSYFYYKKGSGTFNEKDLADKTIGIVTDWASNEKCIARQDKIINNQLDTNHTKLYSTPSDLLRAVNTGMVDAAFADEFTFAKSDIEGFLSYQSSHPYSCILAGNSIMMRKDNNLLESWNIGFNKLLNTRRFQELCKQGVVSHGHKGDVNCIGMKNN